MDAQCFNMDSNFICPKCGSVVFHKYWLGVVVADVLVGVECYDCRTYYHVHNQYTVRLNQSKSKNDNCDKVSDERRS
jgi:hypothetical protein